MKSAGINIVIALAFLVAIPIFVNKAYDNKQKEEVRQGVEEVRSEVIASFDIKNAYIGGCMTEAVDYNYCECTYNKMTQVMSDTQLLQMSDRILYGTYTQADLDLIFDVSNQCI